MSFGLTYIVTVLGHCDDALRTALTVTPGRASCARSTGRSELPKRLLRGHIPGEDDPLSLQLRLVMQNDVEQ